jgi:hypothetical protein
MKGFNGSEAATSVYGDDAMVTSRDIIRKLWDAQGYGNIAVYQDGSTAQVAPGESGETGGEAPVAIFKPIVLVSVFPTVDHALGDAELLETIEGTLRERGMEVERGT